MNSSLFTPDFSHLTGLLQHLNDEELQELLDSEEKLKALISDLKQVNDIEAEREMLLTSNKSISEYNLSKQPILEEHRKQLEETHGIALELKNCLLEKKGKIESNQQATSKDTLLALLQAATSESDGEAETVVDLFLQSELPIDDFLPKYLELRKVAHLRRIKSEKFVSLLREEGSRINTPPTRPQRLRKPPSPPNASSLPYPSSYGNMMAQNHIPVAPVRQAPQPPPFPIRPYGSGYPNQGNPYPQPYGTQFPGYPINPPVNHMNRFYPPQQNNNYPRYG